MIDLRSRILLNACVSFARNLILTPALLAKSSKTAGSERLLTIIMDKTGIDLTGDSDATASPDVSDDEDLRRAIALSLEANPSELSQANIHSAVSSVPQQPQVNSNTLSAFLGIDRKKQEQERLARLKRKRDGTVSPPQLARARRPMANGVAGTGIAKQTDAVMLPLSTSSNPIDAGGQASFTSTPLNSRLQYPNGVVKQTWAFGHPRSGNDIKIEEVLQSSTLQAAILSAFQWDFDWLFPKMDTKRTSFVLVMQAKFESQKKQLRADFDGVPNVRLCFPSMEGQINCMHSKLMLLFYGEYLRVVVPTGNLRPHDWGESGGVMENTVFLIDLPRSNVATTAGQQPQFAEDLLYFVNAQGLPEDVIRRVHEHDFSRTAGLGFVHTTGGMHGGDSWKLTGHCGLGRTVTGLGLSCKNAIEVDYVTSSVGSLNDEFLRSMYLAAQGDDGLSECTLRTSKYFPSKCVDDPKRLVKKDAGAGWKETFRFYYPSDATVRASTGGPDSAGTICFQEKWWNSAKFPRGHMYDCVSRRTGLLMHNKVR
jgi:hypothetical protein